MKEQINRAIALYEAGHLQQCLDLIKPLTQTAQAKSAQAYFRAGALPPDPLVPYQWLDLAVDRIRKEMGEDVIAVMPVVSALMAAAGSNQE